MSCLNASARLVRCNARCDARCDAHFKAHRAVTRLLVLVARLPMMMMVVVMVVVGMACGSVHETHLDDVVLRDMVVEGNQEKMHPLPPHVPEEIANARPHNTYSNYNSARLSRQ